MEDDDDLDWNSVDLQMLDQYDKLAYESASKYNFSNDINQSIMNQSIMNQSIMNQSIMNQSIINESSSNQSSSIESRQSNAIEGQNDQTMMKLLESQLSSLREQMFQLRQENILKSGEIKIVRENMVTLQGKNDDLTKTLILQHEATEREKLNVRNQSLDQVKRLTAELECKNQEIQKMKFHFDSSETAPPRKRKASSSPLRMEETPVISLSDDKLNVTKTPFISSVVIKFVDVDLIVPENPKAFWKSFAASINRPLKFHLETLCESLARDPVMRIALLEESCSDSFDIILERVVLAGLRNEGATAETILLSLKAILHLCMGHIRCPSFFERRFSGIIREQVPQMLKTFGGLGDSPSDPGIICLALQVISTWALDPCLCTIILEKIVPIVCELMLKTRIFAHPTNDDDLTDTNLIPLEFLIDFLFALSGNPHNNSNISIILLSNPTLIPTLVKVIEILVKDEGFSTTTTMKSAVNRELLVKLFNLFQTWTGLPGISKNSLSDIMFCKWHFETMSLCKSLWQTKWAIGKCVSPNIEFDKLKGSVKEDCQTESKVYLMLSNVM